MPEVDWGSLKEQVEIMPQQDDHAMEDVLAYVLGWSSDSATRPFIVGSEWVVLHIKDSWFCFKFLFLVHVAR